MNTPELERIRMPELRNRVTTAEAAAAYIRDGMTVGMSGFTRAGDCKAVPRALAERAKESPVRINLLTGASLGHDTDKLLCEAGVIARRMPFQVDSTLRRKINSGDVAFIDEHLGEMAEQLRHGHLNRVNIAVIEVAAITEQGYLIPTTSVGNSAAFAAQADQIILELNLSVSAELEGLHDIFTPEEHPNRLPIQVNKPSDRVGTPYIPIDPKKIVAIVLTDKLDSPSSVETPDAETVSIAKHLLAFLEREAKLGRLPTPLLPLQSGIGSIANAVMYGFQDSSFSNLTMYSEVLQDSAFDLMDSGKLVFASACSITVTSATYQRVFGNISKYRDRLVLRPQEISNQPEIIRRLGVLAINTALECDIYGNVNSTHVGGTHMMNGIGGSGDYARNSRIAFFVTKSTAKEGALSRVVPMVSHVDQTEHDVDVLVTENGLADLRGRTPRERVPLIIDNCAHPAFREALHRYAEQANKRGGQTPHVLEEALAWHIAANRDKNMAAYRSK